MTEREAAIAKGAIIGVLVGLLVEIFFKFTSRVISLIGRTAIRWWKWVIPFSLLVSLHPAWNYGVAVGVNGMACVLILLLFCAGWATFREDKMISLRFYAASFGLSLLLHMFPTPVGMDAFLGNVPEVASVITPTNTKMPIAQFDSFASHN